MIEQGLKQYENGITEKIHVIRAEGDGFFLSITNERGDLEFNTHGITILGTESGEKLSNFLNEKLSPVLNQMASFGTFALLEMILNEAVEFIETELDYRLDLSGREFHNLSNA